MASQPVQQHHCEILAELVGNGKLNFFSGPAKDPTFVFKARARTPNGFDIVAKSPVLKGEYPYEDLKDYPLKASKVMPRLQKALDDFCSKLMQDGWEFQTQEEPHWYSRTFTRSVAVQQPTISGFPCDLVFDLKGLNLVCKENGVAELPCKEIRISIEDKQHFDLSVQHITSQLQKWWDDRVQD